jgi:ArsR family transcriptional regulator, virulence genes transcriptional regulator
MQQVLQFSELEEKAAEVADILRLLSNNRRLLMLCLLAKSGEMSVGALCQEVGLSQSALSQHLAKLRADNLVKTRRDAQTRYYSIADGRVGLLLEALYDIYCAPQPDHRAATYP